MSDTVKLIIEIPKEEYALIVGDEACGLNSLTRAIAHGTPLDRNSELAEMQAYFAGMDYGWECGRESLIDDVKTEIKHMEYHMIDCDVLVSQDEVLEILDNIGKGE